MVISVIHCILSPVVLIDFRQVISQILLCTDEVGCYTRAPIYRAMKALCIHTRAHSKPADLWCRDGLKEAHF